MTAPHVVVSIEVTLDEYLASYISDQVWQITGGEVVIACDVDRKDSDGCTTQSHQDCYRLEVRVNFNHPVVESLLDVNQDSSTWQLIWIPPPRFAVAIIVGTSVVTQGWRVFQLCFLKAYDIRLMFAYQDIKIPSVISQTSGIPLQNCGSHYDLGCLSTWPFLWLWSGAAFVIGDMTGTKVGPFLLNSNFWRGVGDCLGMYEGASLGPSILPIWAGDMLARGPAVPASSVCEAMWAFETGGLGASPTGVVLWALPTVASTLRPTGLVGGRDMLSCPFGLGAYRSLVVWSNSCRACCAGFSMQARVLRFSCLSNSWTALADVPPKELHLSQNTNWRAGAEYSKCQS